MNLKRVVVTGLGALTPIGNNISEYWDSLIKGRSGCAPTTYFDTENFKTKFACEIKNYNPTDHFERKEARKLDKFAQYAIVSSEEAIKDAAIDLEKVDKFRVGVIWGAGIGGIETFQEEVLGYANGNGTPRFNPFFIPKMIADIAPGHISIRNGFMGPNYTTVSACASSANSMIDALNYIRLGHCDIIVTGGSEAAVTIAGMGGFNAMHALSTRNESPETASRPFDATRDGFVLGEGGGALILEEYEHAKARGAKIYAELIGFGLSGDAHHMTQPSPGGEGAARCMTNAMRNAGINPQEVDYLNAHGTSTPLGDLAETNATKTAFGDHAYKLAVSSTKSMVGHLLGAAGGVEAVYTAMALHTQTAPPTINLNNPSADCDLDYVPNTAREMPLNIALSNSFGFGGTNGTLAFKHYQ